MKLLYITSHGHSGSTLTDMLIGAHPKGMSLGEINMLPIFARGETKTARAMRCACEQDSVHTCLFWINVAKHLEAEHEMNFAEMDLDADDLDAFKRQNRALFKSIFAASDAAFLVDSSKSLSRLLKLTKIDGLDVLPLHLVRGARGQISSMLRKHPDKSIFHHIYIYNLGIIKACIVLMFRKHFLIKYEELVDAPEDALRGIMREIDLCYDDCQTNWAKQERHLIGGNGGVKFKTESALLKDDRWKLALSKKQIILIDVLTLPVVICLGLKSFMNRFIRGN